MAAAILILAWIYHEWSYDRFHAKGKQLHVVYNRITLDGSVQCSDWTVAPLGPALKADYPEISAMTRMSYNDFLFANGESIFKIKTGYIDTDFLTMFDFPLLHGDKEIALNNPYSVILTEQAATRLFGGKDPMGETLLANNNFLLTVTGVIKDLPDNTLFSFEALAPIAFAIERGLEEDNWNSMNLQTFVELHPNASLEQVNESIRGISQAYANNQDKREVFLYPLTKKHLYSRFVNGLPAGGMVDNLRVFAVIAGLILLIACINFTNLSTARSEKRAKEVGVRKVMGGNRFSLIRLFLGESTIVASIAGVIALILALMVLPEFETLVGQRLTLNYTSIWFWLSVLGFILFTGLLAGSYPAFYLSSFLPVKVLKGVFKNKKTSVTPRKVLVVVQFTVACLLIVATTVIHRQMNYAQNRDAGYNKDQLIYAPINGDITKNYELIRQDLLNSRTAVSVTKTASPLTAVWARVWSIDWQEKDPNTSIVFDLYHIDADFSKTIGATIIEGRDIDIYTYPTDSTAMLLNETAVKMMNFEQPVGEIIRYSGLDWRVVGVVKDFIIGSPLQSVSPMIIGGPAGWFSFMQIKLNENNRMADNLARTEQIFKQYNPVYPFEYQFVDEDYARKFQNIQRIGTMATCFAGLTIIISCMGLFALVAYMAESRRKEIGIRKVLGASVYDITSLLSKEFLMLVLVSIAIATPVAWWMMEKWLTGYAYRTNIPWWMFVVVGCLSLGIALLTVGFQAIKAAMGNPVKAIKSE
jgi:ABC-type antimicrobial peptide transport system permease subunit